MFGRTLMNKTIKELRKNQYFTAKELADKLHLDTIEILKLDDKKLKEVEDPLRSQLIPILRGDYMDNIPGL
ncbi:transcriptional regulator [Desulfitobacterium sp. Sab5]|uniref:transcriptional regulator n=1 Tax=Desulfitobacterium nosdiversum TaxID=3375356 RepID=UPI003CEE7AA9